MCRNVPAKSGKEREKKFHVKYTHGANIIVSRALGRVCRLVASHPAISTGVPILLHIVLHNRDPYFVTL